MEQYTKGPLLGKGTFGEVVQATHKEVRRWCSFVKCKYTGVENE